MATSISRLVLNVLSFLVTFLLAIIIVKALMFAVNIIGELPVLGLINHIAGGALGLVLGLVVIWLGFLIITLLYSTAVGSACFDHGGKKQCSDIPVQLQSVPSPADGTLRKNIIHSG